MIYKYFIITVFPVQGDSIEVYDTEKAARKIYAESLLNKQRLLGQALIRGVIIEQRGEVEL